MYVYQILQVIYRQINGEPLPLKSRVVAITLTRARVEVHFTSVQQFAEATNMIPILV